VENSQTALSVCKVATPLPLSIWNRIVAGIGQALFAVPAWFVGLRIFGFGASIQLAMRFQDLYTMSKTIVQSGKKAIPQQGVSNLRGFLTSRLPSSSLTSADWLLEFVAFGRAKHGFASSIEGMRGVRMSLVPAPG
jgi:hypothetical protein